MPWQKAMVFGDALFITLLFLVCLRLNRPVEERVGPLLFIAAFASLNLILALVL